MQNSEKSTRTKPEHRQGVAAVNIRRTFGVDTSPVVELEKKCYTSASMFHRGILYFLQTSLTKPN